MQKRKKRIRIFSLALIFSGVLALGGCKDTVASEPLSSESGTAPEILEEAEDWKDLLRFDESVGLKDIDIPISEAKKYKPQLENADKLPSDAAVEFSYLRVSTGEAQQTFPETAGEYKIRAIVYADGYLSKYFTAKLTIRA